MSSSKNFNAVDAMRVLMALFVVALHRPFLSQGYSSVHEGLTRVFFDIAVPFFFIVSSYFFFAKCDKTNNPLQHLVKFEKRMLILYAFWVLIYVPFDLNTALNGAWNGTPINDIAAETFHILKGYILGSCFSHLWYIYAIILGMPILYFLSKKINPAVLLPVFVVLSVFLSYLVAHSDDTLLGQLHIQYVPYACRNLLRKTLLPCTLGLILSRKNVKIKQSAGWSIFALLFLAEIGFFVWSQHNALVSDIDASVSYCMNALKGAMLFVLCKELQWKPSVHYTHCRAFSSIMYFSHMIVPVSTLDNILKMRIFSFMPKAPGEYLLAVLFALVISTILYSLSQQKHLRFLKKCY